MKKIMVAFMLVMVAGLFLAGMDSAMAQAPATVPVDGAPAAPAAPAQSGGNPMGFLNVIMSSGWLGVVLWLALFGAGGASIYFIVDAAITVRPVKVLPQSLIDNVTAAMAEGDVMKALNHCENEPCPLASILTAGFSHVEEGYEVIQEAVNSAAALEAEKLMQRINWISVCAAIAPMLGLLGTVQGMIAAFANIAQGAPDVAILALNIAQALYTTAGGLATAIPATSVFFVFRNNASKMLLRMEALTMELIKDLRNVEVVPEG
jgi:biopolymer transport protein ExbB